MSTDDKDIAHIAHIAHIYDGEVPFLRPNGTTDVWKRRIAISIRRKDEPQVRAIPSDSIQSTNPKPDWVSAAVV